MINITYLILVNTELKQLANEIFNRFQTHYPDAKCFLVFQQPHELLVSTILSAQCTDKRVNQVTPGLFIKYPTLQSFAVADINELKNDIRSTGFYNNKAKAIKESMQDIINKYDGKIPNTLEKLVGLKGVGRKTANVVLGDAFGVPGVVVDTHVKRISRLLGLTKNSGPVKIEQDLIRLFPPEQWTLLGHLMIDHGRAICVARRPKCDKCFLNDICPSAKIPER